MSTVITGASRPAQVEQNMQVLEVVERLTPEVKARVEKACDNAPDPVPNWCVR